MSGKGYQIRNLTKIQVRLRTRWEVPGKEKIEAASDIFPRSRPVVIENDFNQKQLFPGHIYFLNTQKLGVIKPSDEIWRRAHMDNLADHREYGQGKSNALLHDC